MRSGTILLGLVLSLEGCGFNSPNSSDGGRSGSDGDVDAAKCVKGTFATQFEDACQLAFDGDLELSGTITYDTGTHVLMVNGAVMPVSHVTLMSKESNVDVISARSVRLAAGAVLRATGMLPFAIVARSSITLEEGAMIDVSAGGAGALTVCSSSPTAGSDSAGGGAGGGGAGYSGAGGDGGAGNLDGTSVVGGKKSGSIGLPEGPQGGCSGARGGTGGTATGGLGGLGGGALYLAAADRIELLGMGANGAVLNAGGGGGKGGATGTVGTPGEGGAGGGGGGSGGMIWLEALHLVGMNGVVAANGGGGGGGSSANALAGGGDGVSGSLSMGRASGGSGGVPGGAKGGDGGSLLGPTGDIGVGGDAGGGGGGGGVGYIHFVSGDVEFRIVSPAPR